MQYGTRCSLAFVFIRALFKFFVSATLVGFLLYGSLLAAPQPSTMKRTADSVGKPLLIYFVDVEGGQATLFVAPNVDSLLIDTGWPENGGRDADRIVAAANDAGIHQIDHVLITHFHTDHVGGAPQLASRFAVGSFIDHGDNRESDAAATVKGWNAYQELVTNGKHTRVTVKPGDILPVKGMQALVVSSDGEVLKRAVNGEVETNPACKNADRFPADKTENQRSLGVLVSFGKLKILDLGDLTRDRELDLMCPINQLGNVDIYIVSHHGWRDSGSAVLLNSIAPRIAIMDNGANKGGSPSAWDIVKQSPRLEDFWQLHFSEEGGAAHNAPSEFIANPEGPDSGEYLRLRAWEDGSFEVFNSRTRKAKHYPKK